MSVLPPSVPIGKLGGGGKMTMIFSTFCRRPGVMVKWSKMFTMTIAKISKLSWSNGQNWPFLTLTMAKFKELPCSNGQI